MARTNPDGQFETLLIVSGSYLQHNPQGPHAHGLGVRQDKGK